MKAGRMVVAALLLTGACTNEADDPDTSQAPPPAQVSQGPYASPSPVEIVTRPAKNWREAACDLPVDYVRYTRRDYAPERSPEIVALPREPNFFGGWVSGSHSGPWPYVQEVPLLFYGPGFIRADGEMELDREVTVADIAPTLAELLGFDWPNDRPGRSIHQALVPADERPRPPRVIVTVVWDGGGWNVLNSWPRSWPFLRSLMEGGTHVAGAVVGSSPSVTPAIHATIGTGTFPKQHHIVDIPVRDGDRVVGSYDGRNPQFLAVETLADMYDRATGNVAEIGVLAYKAWHFGMVGHGAFIDGGDKDIAIIADRSGHLVSNSSWYSLPEYATRVPGFAADVRTVDLADGKLDGKWMGHEWLEDARELRHTPAWALYQTRVIKSLLKNEGYGRDRVTDLFFTNYKQIDEVGHDWNMLSKEMPDILRYSDDMLRELTRWLDRNVGRNEWVLTFTADHGQAPDPQTVGAWPIRMPLMLQDVADHFDVEGKDLIQMARPNHLWLNEATLAAAGITEEEVADFLVHYRLEDNVPPGTDLPKQYEKRLREPIFEAAFPSDRIGQIWSCVKKRSKS